jgi:glycosyltransferase involved in cell wall biosynthesis
MSAYACDPYGGSEAHNGWYTAETVAMQGVHVTLATRPECRSNVERYLSASPVSLPIFPEYIMHKGPGTLIKGELGVYASYIQWQRNLSRWVGRQRTSWDIAHHVSWGSIDTPCGVLTAPAPGVIGPVGGGQVMNKDHYRWMEGATRWENLRTSVARASLINPFARTTTTRSQLVLVENQETRDKAVSLGARRVEMLLANCLPKEFISSDARPAETRSMEILWVGRFMPRKAANLAAESFASVVQRVPDAKLKFVGEGPSRAAVEQLVRDLGLEKSVTFTGRLSHADVQTAYESSAAMLFSSLRDSSGAQVLEAAAKGCPVIALNQSGVGYWYPENAGIKVAPTPADDLPQRLADAMVRMLTMDDEDWVEMSSQALEWAREHTWEVRGEELISIYKGLLSP